MKLKGSEVYHTSLITCKANMFMRQIHNRMPVIHDNYTLTVYSSPDIDTLPDNCHTLDNSIVMGSEPVGI
jgi:putative SOS response-associated peptidase YedK